MLRTTISKIRRVCTIAFLPRTQRAARKPSGKFEKFTYAAVCKTQTLSRSDARDNNNDNQPFIRFASNKPPKKRPHLIDNRKKYICREHMNIDSESDKCERLIAKVFGADHDKYRRHQIEGNADNREAIRPQARKDEDADIDSADAAKRANIGHSGGTTEALHTSSKLLDNLAQVNLSSNKNTEFSDKRVKDAVHLSDAYKPKTETNKEREFTTLIATTEKDDEAKLAEKIEKIDESPIGEAEKLEIESLTVTPRTLKQDAKLNIRKTNDEIISPEKNECDKLDEIASRCINAPDDKIDERLLEEMECLKAKQAVKTTDNPVCEEHLAKMEMGKEESNAIQQSNMDAEKRTNIGPSGGTTEALHTPSIVLDNVAKCNNTVFSDKRVNDAVNLSDVVYNPDAERNKEMEFAILRSTKDTSHLSDVYNSKEGTNTEIELATLRATTEKEVEAKLAQKVEKINETPIVEAEKLESEGFNVTPRTLKQDGKLNIKNTKDEIISLEKIEGEKLDDLASRCVNAPDGKIGERLLKEIESVLASQAKKTTDNPMHEEPVAKMEIVTDESNATKQSNMDVEKKEEEKKPADCNILQRLYPTFDGFHFENNIKQEDTSSEIFKSERIYTEYKPLYYEEDNDKATVGYKSIEQVKYQSLDKDVHSDRPKVYPNQVLIDPYDKSTLAHEQQESDSVQNCEHVPLKEIPLKQEEITEIEEITVEEKNLEEEPQKKEFHPKYVVTCNETCPMSAGCLTSTGTNTEAICLKGTAIYDGMSSLDLNKNALQVTIENKLENNMSDSKKEDVHVESEAKPIVNAVAVSESVDKESPISPQEEVIEIQTEVTESKQIAEIFPQPAIALNTPENPNLSKEESTDTLEKDLKVAEPIQRNLASNCTITSTLPKLNDEQASLSELLKRVRERHRMEYCKAIDFGSTSVEHLGTQAAVVQPEIGKCGKNPTPCPPPAPKCPPPNPCPPSPCPPKPPKCPNPCPTKKPSCPAQKNPCAKCKKCTEFGVPNLITILFQPQMYPRLLLPFITFDNREFTEGLIASEVSIKAVLTDEIIGRLQNLVVNEHSPVLSRTFYKTEWTKPKFDINKPYIETRITNITSVSKEKNLNEKPIIQPRKNNPIMKRNYMTKANDPSSESILKSSSNVPSSAARISNLNLERLLIPTMASVSFVIVKSLNN